MGGGVEIGAYQSFGRAGLFDFGNHGGQPCGVFGADGGDKAARRFGLFRLAAECFQWDGSLGGGDFFGFGGEDFLQDVGHGVCLNASLNGIGGGL